MRPPEGTQGKTLSHRERSADIEPGEQAFSEAGEVQRKEEGPQELSDDVMVGGRPAPRPRPRASLCSCTTRGGLGTAPALLALARAHATAVRRETGRCPRAAAQDEPAVNVREEQVGAVHQQGPPQRRSRDLGRRLSWRKGPGPTGRPACGNCTGGRGGGEKGALVGRWAWGLGRKAQTLEEGSVDTGQGSLPVLPTCTETPCVQSALSFLQTQFLILSGAFLFPITHDSASVFDGLSPRISLL